MIFVFGSAARSQDGITDTVYDSILSQVNALYRAGTYRWISGINIDTLTGRRCPFDEHRIYEDPYGTLRGCVVFAATPSSLLGESSPKGLVGIYKGGNIIWHSDTLVDCLSLSDGNIKSTMNLSNDGKVDIISSWDAGDREMVEYLWIFSWDGSTGKLISDTSASGISSLVSFADYVNVLDTDGDGVWEIEGRWPDEDSVVVFRWDGQKYVNSPDKTIPSYPPRNKISGTIRTKVDNVGNKFHYQYVVYNFPTSLQKIDRLYIAYDGDFTLTDATGRIGWHFDYYKGNLIGWLNLSACVMKRGDTDSSFSYNCDCPPRIVNSLIQGENYRFDLSPYDTAGWSNDIFTNSLLKPALSPHLWRTPFDGSDFLDSLKSYVGQSHSLGWIMDQSSADAYARLIDSAKAQLQRYDSVSARREIDTVMQHAIADSAAVLSSEAYALIYFNAQYLLTQMSPAPVSHTITSSAGVHGSIQPQGNNIVGDGSALTFTIRPAPGYHIAGLFIDNADSSAGTDSIYTFSNVTANHVITAFFAVNRYRIIAGAGDGGRIDPHDTVFVDYGAAQSFAAEANSGYAVRGLMVDGTARPAASTYTFANITSNHTIVADFRSDTYTITASAGAGGTIDPAGALIVISGASKSFTIAPAPGYTLGRVIVDGVSRGAMRSYTFTKIVSSHTISASFISAPCLPPCCIDAPASVDRLTLTGANGNRKTLLIRNADRSFAAGVNDSSLASQAGAGSLSAGFQSGQLVESVSPGEPGAVLQVRIQGATYPLTLTVDKNSQNEMRYWLLSPGQPDVELTDATSKQIDTLTAGILEIRARASQPCREQ